MLFSGTIFIFCFLPIVLLGYYLLKASYRNVFLLLASLVFYAWGEPRFVLIMIASIITNYVLGFLIDRFRDRTTLTKSLLGLAVVVNLGLLFVFKYLNFTVNNVNRIFGDLIPQSHIVLPIGISFFTFQAMSYVIDVYRNHVGVQKNPLYLGLYISFFPQLIAGPIVRYSTIEDQISERKITFDDFAAGVRRFMVGLIKKVLIANTMAIIADRAFSLKEIGSLPVSLAWLGAIAYTLQIYFDFSGYSDMAIGLGRMFGFTFLENFNYPYISRSITEFWRRWHISLGTWFRDYLYFPLGGSRVTKKSRLVFNLFIVWLLTGIWHGASWNFIAWGLLYFVILIVEKLWLHPEQFKSNLVIQVYRAFTLLFVVFGWVLFRASGLRQAVHYALSMFGLEGNALTSNITVFYLHENWVYIVAGIICSTPILTLVKSKLGSRKVLAKSLDYVSIGVFMFLFFLSVSYLIVGAHNPFIYFNF